MCALAWPRMGKGFDVMRSKADRLSVFVASRFIGAVEDDLAERFDLTFSTSADPEVQAVSEMIRDVDQMEQRGILQVWPRPPIPEFADIVSILGDEIHFMLQGQISVSEALATSQSRIDEVFRSKNHT